MHEMSLAEGIRDIVEQAASTHNVSAFEAVVLEIGALSAVEVPALLFALEVVLRDSVAQHAEVVIENIPGRGWCLGCNGDVELTALYDACPNCGSYRVQPTQGTEMRVKELRLPAPLKKE